MWKIRKAAKARPPPEVARRFADLHAMPPAGKVAALAGPDAYAWIKAAARHGLAEAQVLLGQLYLDGRTGPSGAGLAFLWFSTAARSGYPPALNMKGRCLENGWDIEVDPVAAAVCYKAAADAGLDWAQYNLANMLLGSTGIARSRPAAYAWYERAAAQGHAKSMNMLGRFHEEGWDRPRQPGLAETWYRRSAERGDYRGQFNLGSLLAQHGRRDEAAVWLGSALRNGSSDFLREAAAMLDKGGDPMFHTLTKQAIARRVAMAG